MRKPTQDRSTFKLWGSIALATVMKAGVLLYASTASAQGDFPNKPIRMLVPFTAGSGADGSARIWLNKCNAASASRSWLRTGQVRVVPLQQWQSSKHLPMDTRSWLRLTRPWRLIRLL